MPKPKTMSKPELIAHWQSLDPEAPCTLTPIPRKHKGTTFTQDTARFTGSKPWIDWCMARFQPLLEYDGNGARINARYTEVAERTRNADGKLVMTENLTGTYAFYFMCYDRGRGQGRPKSTKNKPKMLPVEPHEEAPPPPRKAAPEPKGKEKIPKGDTWFAVGTIDLDEPDGFSWAEPEPGLPAMAVYEFETDAHAAIKKIKKDNKKADLQVVFVTARGRGKFDYA